MKQFKLKYTDFCHAETLEEAKAMFEKAFEEWPDIATEFGKIKEVVSTKDRPKKVRKAKQ